MTDVRMNSDLFFLYGPPGSGKTLLGQQLAARLHLPFFDLDEQVEKFAGCSIAELFEGQGEATFRRCESQALSQLLSAESGVIALGGGTLLDPLNRQRVEGAGPLLCLDGSLATLLARVQAQGSQRPLLLGQAEERLRALLTARQAHYDSFHDRLLVDGRSPLELAAAAQQQLGAYHLSAMGAGYDVRVANRSLPMLGEAMRRRQLNWPALLVTDEHLAQHHAATAQQALEGAGYEAGTFILPPGEGNKNVEWLGRIWQALLDFKLERSSTLVALGGGVVSDLAGFAAATFLRGIRWVCVPTSLIGMVDASLGGKTGADLPQGKNLVGAFYPPGLVLVDPDLLHTLPEVEQRNGLAEVVKHGLIGDPALLEHCQGGLPVLQASWEAVVRQAIAVKVRLIEADPYDREERNSLNLGHTLGHALEQVSGYRLKHGEAVSIGMVFAARLSVALGLASEALVPEISSILSGLGLPVEIPPRFESRNLLAAMQFDKKRQDGRLRFVLIRQPGEVLWHQAVEEQLVLKTLEAR